MIRAIGPIENKVILTSIEDPELVAQARAQLERGRRNEAWLSAHWPELLPNALGRHVAVAGLQAFVADTAEEAWAQAKAAHPNDDGAIMRYVFPDNHPRIYATRG